VANFAILPKSPDESAATGASYTYLEVTSRSAREPTISTRPAESLTERPH